MKMDLEIEAYPTESLKLYPCAICGRNFLQNTLRKHEVICEKQATKKRKAFDSGKQRATGSDVIYEKTKETKHVQVGNKENKPTKNDGWRQQHTELVNAIKNAREYQIAKKTGGKLPQFQPSAIPSDYVQCPFCGRNFNSSAAERHMPFCEEQQKRQKINNSANKVRSNSRIKYQPPIPQNRKKSSDGIPSKIPTYNQSYHQQLENNSGNSRNNSNTAGLKNNQPKTQTNSRPFKSSSECKVRKPLKYDSNLYGDNDTNLFDDYTTHNRPSRKENTIDDPILRTGRNVENNVINSEARRRSGNRHETPPVNRSPVVTANKQNSVNNGKRLAERKDGTKYTSKFCVECGTQFPVEWAKFCCLCGEGRV